MQCQLPISCGTSKEQLLAGNSLQLITSCITICALLCNSCQWHHCVRYRARWRGELIPEHRPRTWWAQIQEHKMDNSEATGPCFTALPTHSTQAGITIWSINHRRWVNRRMNSSNSCLLEICDCCSGVEKQKHIQKMPMGQWTSRG